MLFRSVDTVMGQGINQGPTAGAVFSPTSLITKSFPQGEFTLFRFPQGLKKLPSENGYSVDELVRTTPKTMAFATMNIKGESPMESFALVDEVTGKWDGDANGKPFHAIVAGDVDFLTNQMLYQHMNRDLVLNSISALAKEENLISIMPKEPQATQLVLTDTKMGVYTFAFLIPLPILLLGLGTGLWIRRRNA